MHEQLRRSNRRLIGIVIVILALAAGLILGAMWYFHIPRTFQAYRLFQQAWSSECADFDMQLTVDMDGDPQTCSGKLSWYPSEESRIYRIRLSDLDLYLGNHVLCFENGKAYTLTEETVSVPTDFLSFLGGMTIDGSKEEGFTVSSLDSDAPSLLIGLLQRDGLLSELSVSVETVLEGSPLRAQLTLIPTGAEPEALPNAVRTAIQAGGHNTEPLTTSLLRLLAAGTHLMETETIGAEVTWSVRGGVLSLGDTFFLYRKNRPEGPVYSVGKENFSTFDPEKPETELENTAAVLPGILYAALSGGETTCTEENGRFTYTLSLDAPAMESLCYALAPEAQDQWITFTEGQVALILTDSRLSQIQIQCSGEIDALLLTIPVALELNAQMLVDPVFPE